MKAFEFSSTAYTLQPDSAEVSLVYGMALLAHGRKKEALRVLNIIAKPNEDVTNLIRKISAFREKADKSNI